MSALPNDAPDRAAIARRELLRMAHELPVVARATGAHVYYSDSRAVPVPESLADVVRSPEHMAMVLRHIFADPASLDWWGTPAGLLTCELAERCQRSLNDPEVGALVRELLAARRCRSCQRPFLPGTSDHWYCVPGCTPPKPPKLPRRPNGRTHCEHCGARLRSYQARYCSRRCVWLGRGRPTPPPGGNRKTDVATVRSVFLASGSAVEVAARFGLARQAVSAIWHRSAWAAETADLPDVPRIDGRAEANRRRAAGDGGTAGGAR